MWTRVTEGGGDDITVGVLLSRTHRKSRDSGVPCRVVSYRDPGVLSRVFDRRLIRLLTRFRISLFFCFFSFQRSKKISKTFMGLMTSSGVVSLLRCVLPLKSLVLCDLQLDKNPEV